ncbi:hypothetical protein NUK55_08960 [Aeromonas veronii]|nr:hypothetical protein [Aeromonas veronii]MCR3971227.1 hypothetical protein [Aeromonas veronii]MCR3975555.1 hypothetical protein [Aeromonas veronii]
MFHVHLLTLSLSLAPSLALPLVLAGLMSGKRDGATVWLFALAVWRHLE